ncbi:MAG: VacJ family lipoprotein [Desulfobulbaceae bacterium]|nr:VacJ family lipoprotein [Desulfobulbaceae bacterium]
MIRRAAFLLVIIFFIPGATVLSQATAVFGRSGGQADFLSDEFYSAEAESELFNDPLEPMNRVMFTFNDRVYIWVMEPVATLYSEVVPWDIRGCINSFFRNLEEPVRFINTLLQGRFSDSVKILERFVINSTLGVYGFADAAGREFGINPVHASMGETLESWGIGDGLYLVIPLYGASTLREITGTVVDSLEMTPYYTWTDDLAVNGAIFAGKKTNDLSLHLGQYEEWKQLLFDPYISFRNAYFQYRRQVRYRPVTDDDFR